MKYIFTILFIATLFFRGISQAESLVKVAQVDIFIQDSSFKFQITKLPQIKTEDDVLELIFMLYVLEHNQNEVITKIKEIGKSGLYATKPIDKAIMRL